MKKLLIFGYLIMWGCAMAPSPHVEEFGKVTDESGNNQLVARSSGTRFLNHVAPGSIWDAATAHHNICPGDYVIRKDWVDVDGRRHTRNDDGLVGELWKGSSVGPTFDGRLGVDFCVPADLVCTTFNPKSSWGQA
jgi:hypothetical protein